MQLQEKEEKKEQKGYRKAVYKQPNREKVSVNCRLLAHTAICPNIKRKPSAGSRVTIPELRLAQLC